MSGRCGASGMATDPILYSFRRCPYAMRARLALLASGTVCAIREVKLSAKPAALIATNDGAFKHHLDRYKYPHRHGSDPIEHRTAGLAILGRLDTKLASARYLGGPARGLTDAALFPFVRQFAETDRPWFDAQPLPHVQAWLADHLAWPLFERAMVRLDPWQADDAPILFPGA